MPLTSAQLVTLKASIDADAELAALPLNDDSAFYIASVYNELAAPAFIVWRTNIPSGEFRKAVTWTEYIGRSQGERDAFVLMTGGSTLSAADPNVRQGLSDVFSGPSGATTRATLIALAKRSATVAEKLFATGTGSDATPATMAFEGSLSYVDVRAARSL